MTPHATKHYLIHRNGRWVGHFSEQDLRRFWAVGSLLEDDFVYEEGTEACQRAADLLGGAAPIAQGPKVITHHAEAGGYEELVTLSAVGLPWIHHGLTLLAVVGAGVCLGLSLETATVACFLTASLLLVAGAAMRLTRVDHCLALVVLLAALSAVTLRWQEHGRAEKASARVEIPRLNEKELAQRLPGY